MARIKKIVVTGPESTGKSTLCEQLAGHYKTAWVPEYAREYLLNLNRPYDYNDLLVIAKEQLNREDRIVANSTTDMVFVDTDMYVMKVWCEFVYNKCHAFILDEIAKRKYDGYLLCNTDLPWVKDALREYPDPRTRTILFHMYKDLLINQNSPWTEIRGENLERFNIGVSFVNDLLLQ